ncbi:alpha/beta fold hydrolase [Marinomonas pollencensis]|uniref:Pimeloyl-ACP methyl ester carboxylesterase n=1 Tax=Marinomonas pollencensis TaxID=491954 RepID=A0A3E0D9U2_9GAMM|nr:alpha/beta hydrolase [Marinomonas pollencensis]REG79439.1 pimeloyl-ACP methyl ester carboxylesterase [Marinomonas pollencensis]
MKEIYCLPGTMCDDRLWQLIRPLLGDIKLRHIVLPMEDSLEGMVMALAEQLPDKPFHLLGFSMGGYLASAFAVKYPARIKQLMVISNAAMGLMDNEVAQRKQALNWVLKQGYKGIPAKKAIAMLGERNKESRFLLSLIQAMDASLGEAVLIQQLSCSLERPTLWPKLNDLELDCCFCVGEEDILLPNDICERLLSYPNVSCYSAKHSGHMIPLEQPVWLAQKIQTFFFKSSQD